jgi:hydrogenase nickel incorporation protein HypB
VARENARRVHPDVEILELSCRTGAGLDSWLAWLDAMQRKFQAETAAAAR